MRLATVMMTLSAKWRVRLVLSAQLIDSAQQRSACRKSAKKLNQLAQHVRRTYTVRQASVLMIFALLG